MTSETMIPAIFYGGMSYSASPVNPSEPDNWKGFGGRHFTVKFYDGRIFKTDNLVMGFSAKEQDNAIIYPGWDPEAEKQSSCRWQKLDQDWVFVS